MKHFSEIATFNFNLMLYKRGCQHPSKKKEKKNKTKQNTKKLCTIGYQNKSK